MSERKQVRIKDLSEKYGGKEVAMISGTEKIGKYDYPYTRLDSNDETIKSLRAEFEGTGIKLRIFDGDTMGTMDVNRGRVNVYIKQESDGKYRIQPEFKVG